MIGAKKYLENYYGDKEKAIQELEKWINLYEQSPRKPTPKVVKRIEDYKNLLSEIKNLK